MKNNKDPKYREKKIDNNNDLNKKTNPKEDFSDFIILNEELIQKIDKDLFELWIFEEMQLFKHQDESFKLQMLNFAKKKLRIYF